MMVDWHSEVSLNRLVTRGPLLCICFPNEELWPFRKQLFCEIKHIESRLWLFKSCYLCWINYVNYPILGACVIIWAKATPTVEIANLTLQTTYSWAGMLLRLWQTLLKKQIKIDPISGLSGDPTMNCGFFGVTQDLHPRRFRILPFIMPQRIATGHPGAHPKTLPHPAWSSIGRQQKTSPVPDAINLCATTAELWFRQSSSECWEPNQVSFQQLVDFSISHMGIVVYLIPYSIMSSIWLHGIRAIWYYIRRKFRSQTSDNMDRRKAEQVRGREKGKD